jgi:DNA-binding CsgD family transcriptional regulator
MTVLAVPKRAARRVSADDAMTAWFAGDFELCLELCDGVRLRDARTRIHIGLLRARAQSRLHRYDESLRTLSELGNLPHGSDEFITAQMLIGEARVRKGDTELGLSVLREARAVSTHVHRTIQSELALYTGLAHYCRHELDLAENVLAEVTPGSDIVYARAKQYLGWIAQARGDLPRAVRLFTEALRFLDACEHRDRLFEAVCVRALAHLALERLDPETWAYVAGRRDRLQSAATMLAESHFFIASCAAVYRALVDGDFAHAVREARYAEQIAPSDAFRAQARCRRASVVRQAGERVSHADHVETALDLFRSLDAESLSGDEKTVALILAEELCTTYPAEARSLVALYRSLAPMEPMRSMVQSGVGEMYVCFVEASVFEAFGNTDKAISLYRDLFRRYRAVGYMRRALDVALRLWNLTGQPSWYSFAVEATAHLADDSWLKQSVASAKERAIKLTLVQREVLALICQGKSNPEIARLRKRSLHTVRNLVARLFEIFEVSSREQLAVECVRRGLYAAAPDPQHATARGA